VYSTRQTTGFPVKTIPPGKYEGLRKINGKSQPSIFREYADCLADALAAHYAKARGK